MRMLICRKWLGIPRIICRSVRVAESLALVASDQGWIDGWMDGCIWALHPLQRCLCRIRTLEG